ncbi:hypothetical protein TRIUR3_33703 [Triticum urartu]|uniref:Uncharacterized protein n=1 Tax=Triticum urartu TaxID=4572 RepID=M7ZP16_TRIUA|nr:hypothetical protein TRIUR3_33703 [Triticum urartu]
MASCVARSGRSVQKGSPLSVRAGYAAGPYGCGRDDLRHSFAARRGREMPPSSLAPVFYPSEHPEHSRAVAWSICMMRPFQADSRCEGVHTVARRATTPATRPSAHCIAAQHAYGRIKVRIVDIEISEDFVMLSVDDRCGMELDETDMAVWLKLEAATEEFIQKKIQALKMFVSF